MTHLQLLFDQYSKRLVGQATMEMIEASGGEPINEDKCKYFCKVLQNEIFTNFYFSLWILYVQEVFYTFYYTKWVKTYDMVSTAYFFIIGVSTKEKSGGEIGNL